MTAFVIVNTHEPHHEVAGRLLALADSLGHPVWAVVAQRGEHDAALSFQVPDDVAEAFNEERADHWPTPEELVDDDNDPTTPPVRKTRPGKA